MSTVERKAWHCDECGFEWLQTEGVVPVQCPSRGCRTRKWNLLRTAEEEARVRVMAGKEAEKAGRGKREPAMHSVERSTGSGCVECGALIGHQKWCKARE
jgi:hypothetical protein